MASSQSLLLLSLSTLLLLLVAAEAATAPGPTPPAPLNLTDILVKGGQYATFLRLLNETQYGAQLQSQLNTSYDGFTVFAPSDNAFQKLKQGTLNNLNSQQQVQLIQYQVLPKYYTFATFQTASNPVPTQASGSDGVYTVNVTGAPTGQQVNVSTGVMETRINNALYSAFPLSVYAADDVLLPYALFGAKPPAAAASPPPAASAEKPKKGDQSAAEGPSTKENSGSYKGRVMGWGFVVGMVAMVGIVL
ncbi:putative fasciclin-like arabinogalactan protein 11 [Iris pallida]|uniref:Fasciclin-like arabinogalactan protein 11 n=1 Tax=Iris pallida TaxID=29817 RepID=A0AAX6I2F6_IRIPA|nr:putative fasciclin-like arabinogalactan protein 11 [Iris pallida]